MCCALGDEEVFLPSRYTVSEAHELEEREMLICYAAVSTQRHQSGKSQLMYLAVWKSYRKEESGSQQMGHWER